MAVNGVPCNIDNLIESLKRSGNNYDFERIREAADFAACLHEGQFRVSGEPYISHPRAVAEIVATLGLDTSSICAALLHDTVEDCSDKTDLGEIQRRFGEEVAMLVDGLTKLVSMEIEDKEEAHIENLRKMLLAMSRDIRVAIHNLQKLHGLNALQPQPDPSYE